jgi:acetylornithine/N-succinyldiaminopimelate aminotransferase
MSNAVLPVYGPSPVVFERGEGVRMYDDKGKPYLDFIAGIAVNALGHCHPALVKALSDAGEQAVAHVEHVPRAGAGAAGAALCRSDVRGFCVLHELGRRVD